MLSHANALAFVDWAVGEFAVRETDRLSSHAPLHFDLSIFDIFAAAQAGAAVVLVPEGLALFPVTLTRWIDDYEITIWYSVPSILTLLVLRGKLADNPPAALRTVLFAGEVFPTKHLKGAHGRAAGRPLRQSLRADGDERLHVVRGCRPGQVMTRSRSRSGSRSRATRPLPFARTARATERGEVGELWITGATVMQGYWGDRGTHAGNADPERRGRLNPPIAPEISRAWTPTGTGSTWDGATRRSRAAAIGSSSATSRRHSTVIPRSSNARSSQSRTRS